jgi:hypothetical protein
MSETNKRITIRWISDERVWLLDSFTDEFFRLLMDTEWVPHMDGFYWDSYFPVGLFLHYCNKHHWIVDIVQE